MAHSATYPPTSKRITNTVMLTLTGVCAFAVVAVLIFILGYLVVKGASSLNLAFFTKLPVPEGEVGGGMANAIVGSGKLILIAAALGVPLGLLGGIHLAEFASGPFAAIVRYTADLLNGVPSIVTGLFIYTLMVQGRGFSTLAGGVALGIMMIPIALRSTEEFLRGVPRSLREGAMSLGASKTQTIMTVIVPAALPGIVTGIMLNLARVAGETAPLLFTSFNSPFWSPGFTHPTASLPVVIFNYAISPYEDQHRQAWAGGFVLLAAVLLINIVARFILSRRTQLPR